VADRRPHRRSRIELAGDTAWWVERRFGKAGELEDGCLRHGLLRPSAAASWILARTDARSRSSPDELRREVAQALRTYVPGTRQVRRS
jgi:hypothetical protein